jgi:putative ABC transport system permease protein
MWSEPSRAYLPGMKKAPVGRALRGGVTRLRVQTLVIGLVLLVSTAASVLGLALLVDSNAPFDSAFAAQHGADVTVTVDASKATTAQLTATKRLPEVAVAAGPFATLTATLRLLLTGPGQRRAVGFTLPPLTLAGRSSPGGPVDDITLQSGHWPTGPGQIVLADDQAEGGLPVAISVGEHVAATSAPGQPELTVVGLASSVTSTADGWVTPAEIGRLTASSARPSAQLLCRFVRSGSATDIRADVAAITRALPSGAVTGTDSYLTVRLAETSGIAPIAPFVTAFGVIGLVMSVLIAANVVSGAVVSGYRRIGILKSIGFTPAQVSAAYAGIALVPAVVGGAIGLLLGNLLAGALLNRAADVYQVGTLGVPAWVNVAVPAAMVVVVGIAALVPAVRAGRLTAINAIASGRAPRAGRGYAAHRLLSKLPVPRPVTIGLAAPFTRPARTVVVLIATVLGAAAVTFGVGVGASLGRVQSGLDLSSTEQVFVGVPAGPGPGGGVRVIRGHGAPAGGPGGPGSAPMPLTPATVQRAVTAAIRAQPGTWHFAAETDQQVTVPGLSQQIPVTAYRGNARWLGYDMISGRWYTGPGQVDVPTYFLTVTGTSVGDDVTFSFGGKQLTARIVGEVFDSDNNGLSMITDWQTLANADKALAQPNQYDIGLRPGTSAAQYVQALSTALGPAYLVTVNAAGRGLQLILGLIGLLILLLATVAALGVLNTVALQAREKVHDLGVFKAVGMTPWQTIAMVVCWVAGIGLLAGLIAVPVGIALQHYLVPVMAGDAGTALPASILNVYGGWQIAALALAGMVIAMAGALAPAGWAASARTATALRAE